MDVVQNMSSSSVRSGSWDGRGSRRGGRSVVASDPRKRNDRSSRRAARPRWCVWKRRCAPREERGVFSGVSFVTIWRLRRRNPSILEARHMAALVVREGSIDGDDSLSPEELIMVRAASRTLGRGGGDHISTCRGRWGVTRLEGEKEAHQHMPRLGRGGHISACRGCISAHAAARADPLRRARAGVVPPRAAARPPCLGSRRPGRASSRHQSRIVRLPSARRSHARARA